MSSAATPPQTTIACQTHNLMIKDFMLVSVVMSTPFWQNGNSHSITNPLTKWPVVDSTLQFHQIRGDRAFCCVIYGSFLALPKKGRIRTSATSHKETYFHARQKEQIGRGSTNWHQMDRPANHAHIKLPLLRQTEGKSEMPGTACVNSINSQAPCLVSRLLKNF